MTDDDWTDEHERSLADLLGFDPADERDDDVPDAVGTRVQALLTEVIGDEPAADSSPLAVIAAARRGSDAPRDARRDRQRTDAAADFVRRRRRSTVTKGVLIAAAAALVVVAVPMLFRGASSSNSASTSAVSATTAAAGEFESDSAGGARAPAVSSEAASSAAASAAASEAASSAADTASAAGSAESPSAPVPTAGASGSGPKSASAIPRTSGGLSEQDTAISTGPKQPIAPGSVATSTAGTEPASAGGVGTCVWPDLSAAATAAALRALGLAASTPVQQSVRAACAAGELGAVTIPSAGVTVLVARDNALTSDPQYGYSTARATATGGGISVLVSSTPAAGADQAELTVAQRAAVARVVLAAVR